MILTLLAGVHARIPAYGEESEKTRRCPAGTAGDLSAPQIHRRSGRVASRADSQSAQGMGRRGDSPCPRLDPAAEGGARSARAGPAGRAATALRESAAKSPPTAWAVA